MSLKSLGSETASTKVLGPSTGLESIYRAHEEGIKLLLCIQYDEGTDFTVYSCTTEVADN